MVSSKGGKSAGRNEWIGLVIIGSSYCSARALSLRIGPWLARTSPVASAASATRARAAVTAG